MRSGYLNNLEPHADLLADPLVRQAFTWLQANPHPTPRKEAYPIVGEDVFAIVIEFTPASIETGNLETHHEYIDLQVCKGPQDEHIIVADATTLTVTEDRPEGKDVTFYATPPLHHQSYVLHPGTFVFFDTEVDAHMPQRSAGVGPVPADQPPKLNLKVVIKLRKSALTPGLQL